MSCSGRGQRKRWSLAAELSVLRTERDADVGVMALRRSAGHAGGMVLSMLTISQAPRIMDAVVCSLAGLRLVTLQGECSSGASGLGEGGLRFAWSMAPPLLGLILIMEVALWLQRLYSAPLWLPPVVAILGCPALLAFLAGLNEGFPWFMWEVGVVMGLPVALAFTAYWLPLRLSQARAMSAAPRGGEPQNNEMQLTSHG